MDKHSTRPGSTVLQIPKLEIRNIPSVKAKDAQEPTTIATATDFWVRAHYNYTPGDKGNLNGAYEDAEEPVSPELELIDVTADADAHFDGLGVRFTALRGSSLWDLFSFTQKDDLELRILAGASGEDI